MNSYEAEIKRLMAIYEDDVDMVEHFLDDDPEPNIQAVKEMLEGGMINLSEVQVIAREIYNERRTDLEAFTLALTKGGSYLL